MTKEHFIEVLREYAFTDAEIERMWNTKPSDELCEARLRKAAEYTASHKHLLTQI